VTEKTISFGEFVFPMEKGLQYLVNENLPETDFLHVNEPRDAFSMTFEKDFPIFTVPKKSERDYLLFELKRQDRIIKFFCPEKREHLDTAVWYFYMELFDESGEAHTLPGQVRVGFDGNLLRRSRGTPRFVEVLEGVKLNETDTKGEIK
jgi:hypothetical protein